MPRRARKAPSSNLLLTDVSDGCHGCSDSTLLHSAFLRTWKGALSNSRKDTQNTDILFQGDSAVRAGVKTLPLIVFWVTSSALRGHLMPRFKWYQSWYIAGSMLNIVAGVLLCKLSRAIKSDKVDQN